MRHLDAQQEATGKRSVVTAVANDVPVPPAKALVAHGARSPVDRGARRTDQLEVIDGHDDRDPALGSRIQD
jgi:hypothetical protein